MFKTAYFNSGSRAALEKVCMKTTSSSLNEFPPVWALYLKTFPAEENILSHASSVLAHQAIKAATLEAQIWRH